jgi:hypothetical protein
METGSRKGCMDMIHMLKSIICKFRGHNLKSIGSCPYTGSDYDVCEYCLITFPRQAAVD